MNEVQKTPAYTGPCAKARAWLAGIENKPISRARRWQYRQIAALDLPWQRRLDELGASMRQVRWVASANQAGERRRRAQVDLRYRALVRFLEGKSEHATFQDLVDSFATYDPRTGAEIPPVATAAGT